MNRALGTQLIEKNGVNPNGFRDNWLSINYHLCLIITHKSCVLQVGGIQLSITLNEFLWLN